MATLEIPSIQNQNQPHPPIGTIIFNCFSDIGKSIGCKCPCASKVQPELSFMEMQRIEHEKELLLIRDHPIRRKRKVSVAPSINAVTELGELEDLSEATGEEANKCATTLTSWEQKKMTRRLSRRMSQVPNAGGMGMDPIQENGLGLLQTARLQAMADKAINNVGSRMSITSNTSRVRQSTEPPMISVDEASMLPIPNINRSRRPSNVVCDKSVIAIRDQVLKRRFSIAAGGNTLLGLDDGLSLQQKISSTRQISSNNLNTLKSTEVLVDKFSAISNNNESDQYSITTGTGVTGLGGAKKTESNSGLPKAGHMSITSLGRQPNNKRLGAPRARGRRMSMVSMDCIPGSSLNLEKDRNCQVLAGVIPDPNANNKEEDNNNNTIKESTSRYENKNFATFNSDLVEKVMDRIVFGDVISEENLRKDEEDNDQNLVLDEAEEENRNNNEDSTALTRQSVTSNKPRISGISNKRRDSAFSIGPGNGQDTAAVLSSREALENSNPKPQPKKQEEEIDALEQSFENLLDFNDMMPSADELFDNNKEEEPVSNRRTSTSSNANNNTNNGPRSSTMSQNYQPRKSQSQKQNITADNTSSLILQNLKEREVLYTQKIQAAKQKEMAARNKFQSKKR